MLQTGDILLIGSFQFIVQWVKGNNVAFLFKDCKGIPQVIVLRTKSIPQLTRT